MYAVALFLAGLAALLRWAGHGTILFALVYGVKSQFIDTVAAAVIALLALAVLTLLIQALANLLGALAHASAPLHSAATKH